MRQSNIVEIPRSTTMFWRVGVRTAPEKPRDTVIGIQPDKSGNEKYNASLFDHINARNMIVVLNSTKYSPLDANANFTKYQFAQFHKYMTEFTHDYYGMDPFISGNAIHPLAYKELTPYFL